MYTVLAIFKTLNFKNQPFVKDMGDWSVELINEEREFCFLDILRFARDLEEGKIDPATYVHPTRLVKTDAETPHFLIQVYSEEMNPDDYEIASDKIDEIVSVLGMIYNNSLVGELIEKNIVYDGQKGGFGGIAPRYKPFEIDKNNTFARINKIIVSKRENEHEALRSRLLARLNSRFRLPQSTEQAFLDMWMVLDVLPMDIGSNPAKNRKELAKILGTIVGVAPDIVERKLKLKHLQNVRGHLAHNGTFEPMFSKSRFEDTDLLSAIVDVIMRDHYGFPYGQQLHEWLN